MNLQNRIAILINLGEYLESNSPEWEAVKQATFSKNPWFTDEFIEMAKNNIVQHFLQSQLLENWCTHYSIPNEPKEIKNIGIVMAGNIPMVGFHDFLSVFISGHRQTIKLSSKDDVLLKHIIDKMISWDVETQELIIVADQLKQCDSYIATGSNQSAGYFETYFENIQILFAKIEHRLLCLMEVKQKLNCWHYPMMYIFILDWVAVMCQKYMSQKIMTLSLYCVHSTILIPWAITINSETITIINYRFV